MWKGGFHFPIYAGSKKIDFFRSSIIKAKSPIAEHWTGYGVRHVIVHYHIMPELYPFILRVLGAEQSIHEEFVTYPLTTFKIIPFCRSHPRRLCVQISVALSLSLTKKWFPELSFYDLWLIPWLWICVVSFGSKKFEILKLLLLLIVSNLVCDPNYQADS